MAWRKEREESDDSREEKNYCCPEEKTITENSKKTISLRTLIRTLLMRNLKRTLSL